MSIYSLIYLKKTKHFLKFSNAIRAELYFENHRVNLLTSQQERIGIENLISELESIKASNFVEKPRVYHLFYELGEIILKTKLTPDVPLALVIEYKHSEKFFPTQESCPIELSEATQTIEFGRYQKGFKQIQNYLHRGEAYQINYTHVVDYALKSNFSAENFLRLFLSQKSQKSAYAHLTYVESLNQMFLSNSPECLFGMKTSGDQMDLYTMPIKGSVKMKSPKEFKSAWKKLKNSKKEQAELFMISDLLRNDLNRIDQPIARVVKRKMPLSVIGILHQYSLISVKIKKNISVWKILAALFPGGSITGAPKKRVVSLIQKLETRPRGFYCGSTLIMFKQHKQASINIRSAVIDFQKKTLTYGSGGGITLQSKCAEEYTELALKQKSFLKFLNQTS